MREEVQKHTLVSALASEEELLVGTAIWVCWHTATNSPQTRPFQSLMLSVVLSGDQGQLHRAVSEALSEEKAKRIDIGEARQISPGKENEGKSSAKTAQAEDGITWPA